MESPKETSWKKIQLPFFSIALKLSYRVPSSAIPSFFFRRVQFRQHPARDRGLVLLAYRSATEDILAVKKKKAPK